MNKCLKSLLLLSLLWIASPAWAQQDAITEPASDPKLVVEAAVNGIVHALESRADQNTLSEADRDAIRQQVEGRFDYREMARRSIGRDWNKQSNDAQENFTKTFRDLLERSYGNRLAEYHGQTIVYDNAEFKRDKARVKTRVIDTNKETPVEYRLHKSEGAWQVYDIKIEGVSLVGTFREDFKPVLKNDGFDGLLKALQEKVARLKAKDAA